MSKSARLDDSYGSTRTLSSPSRRLGTHLRRSVSVLVRYGPTTSMSGAAVATAKACDTTWIAGAAACGAPVGIGSGVRTSVVAVGSTVGAANGVAVALAAIDGVDEAVSLGAAAGATHAPSTITAMVRADQRAARLDISLGHRAANFHPVAECDLRQRLRVDVAASHRGADIIEIPDHRRGREQDELSAWGVTNPETMLNARRNEDERACGATVLPPFDEENVLAIENVERLGGVAMDVQWRTEIGRFVGLEQRECAARVTARCLHGHPEAAEIDRTSLARPQHERVGHLSSGRRPSASCSAPSHRARVCCRSA